MSIILNDNFKINVGNPIDSKYLASTNQPYASVSAVNTAIVESQRYVGLTVNINNVEYWYGAGVTDGSLVIKDSGIASTGITAARNGLTKDGDAVLLGGSLTGATEIDINSNALCFTTNPIQYTADYSGQYVAQSIPDAEFVTGLTCQSVISASNGITKTDQDIKLGGTTPLSETTNICGADNVLNIGTAASKISDFTVNTGNAAILASGTTDICPVGALTLFGSSIAVQTVAAYDNSKAPFSALQIPDAQWVTGKTSQAILTADNGLTKDASDKVVLGGTLTGDTYICTTAANRRLQIDGIDSTCCTTMVVYPHSTWMTTNDSSNSASNTMRVCNTGVLLSSSNATNPSNSFSVNAGYVGTTIGSGLFRIYDNRATTVGLEYNADYRTGFTNCTLVTKEYVDDSTGAIGGENGLTKDGDNIVLGGTLTGHTEIDTGLYQFCLNTSQNDSCLAFGYTDGRISVGCLSAAYGIVNATDVSAGLTSSSGSSNSSIGVQHCHNNGGGKINFGANASIISCHCSTGFYYVTDHSAGLTPRWIPDAAWVTGKTSAGFTNATNGLTGVAPNVCLGGTLSVDTIINLNNGNCFELCDNGLNVSYKFDLLGVTLAQCGSSFQITNSGADYKLTHCSGRLVDLTSSGLTYGGNYESCFKPHTLVTKNYVDNATGGIDANNGLDRQGNNIVLGGALTGDTDISAGGTLTISAPLVGSDVQSFTFDSTPTLGAYADGRLYYENCALNFDREVSGVTLQIGEEQVIRVTNVTGNPLDNGTVVYIPSAIGGVPTVAKASASNFSGARMVGLLTQDIANSNEGYVTTDGTVHGLNTGSFSVGDAVWVSTTAGAFTNVRPDYPDSSTLIGIVTVADSSVGEILVRSNNIPDHVDIATFTGYTATTNTLIGTKLDTSIFETYSGTTDGRLDVLEITDAIAITGVTNGLTKVGSHDAKLGGALTEATTLNGAYVFTVGTANNICLATTTTKDIGLNAKSNGEIYLKSQSGTVDGSDMGNAVGISLDYNGAMLVTDNRTTPRGLQYNEDYTSTFLDRSLVDKYYVDSIATGLNVHASVAAATTISDGNQGLSGETGTIDGVEISGITASAVNRILVKNQTEAKFNGIYSASTGIWGRTEDYDFSPSGEISNGDLVPVISGTSLANSQWINVSENPIVSGDSINFSVFSQQQGVTGGDGIEVTTVGSNREVAVDLAPSNCGLAIASNALKLDFDIYTSGLTTAATAGEVQVCACTTAISGNEINVKFGTNNLLVVDSGDFSYTCADNGLTKVGCNVTLGGTLTGNSSISGDGGVYDLTMLSLKEFGLSFECSTITDNTGGQGLVYAGDYSSTFICESLVSKYYVDNAVTGNTLLTYNNGITKAADTISWGGALTGDTSVSLSTQFFCVENTGILAQADCSCVLTQPTLIQLYTDSASCASQICLNGDGTMSIVADNATQGLTITSAAHGAIYAGDYEGSFVPRSLVTCKYVDSVTSGITNAFTTANNGLCASGQIVSLGGDLTGNTIINGGNANSLSLGGASAENLTALCVYATCSYFSNAVTMAAELDVTAEVGLSSCLTVGNNTLLCGTLNVSGATWLDSTLRVDDTVTLNTVIDGSVATDCILVRDSNGVIKKVASNLVGVTTATNGVCVDGDNFVLGGDLTGNTTIGGAFDMTFDNTNINLTAAVCVTGAMDMSSTLGVAGNTDLNGTLNVAGATALQSTLDVTGATTLTSLSASGAADLNSTLNVAGATALQSTLITTGATTLCSTLTLPTVVAGTVSNPIMVLDSGVVKCVAASSFDVTAANGLCADGNEVALGGTLCDANTIIAAGTNQLSLTGVQTANGSSAIYVNEDNHIQIGTFTGQTHSGVASRIYFNVDDTNWELNSGSGSDKMSITMDTNTYNQMRVEDSVYDKGLVYAGDYEDQFTARSLVTKQYVSGITSGITGAFTTANNGLCASGQIVSLGGTLTGATCINTDTYALNIQNPSSGTNPYGICVDTAGGASMYYDCDGSSGVGAKVEVQATAIEAYTEDSSNFKGFIYANGFTTDVGDMQSCSIPDVAYVTGITCAGITTANNGLCVTSPQTVSLGGALTGNTTVTGAYTMAFTNTTFNVTATNIGLTGIVAVTGAMTASSTLGVTGAITGAGTLNISGATWLDSTLRVDDALTLNSVADGSTSDNVLTITSGGEVQKISSSSLGEDNNVYDMTVVTTDVTLTTGSTYVQLVNNASSGLTLTLPAAPIDGQVFRIKDAAGAALTYPVTIGRNGKNIDGAANDGILNTDGGALELVYNDSLGSWFVFSFVN